jgi:hypothetical protein
MSSLKFSPCEGEKSFSAEVELERKLLKTFKCIKERGFYADECG